MVKRVVVALAVLALLTAVSVSAFDVGDHPWTKSIVLVGNMASPGMGTGFIVTADGYIVTAGHVVESAGSVVIFPTPLLYRPARLVYFDPLHDVAVLKVEIANFEIAPLSVGKLAGCSIGDEIYTLGHPLGIGWLLGRGILSAVKYDEGGYAYLFSDVATAPGSSGSPILNKAGEIIGMVQGGFPGVGCVGVAAEPFISLLSAIVENDRKLEATRYELEKLQERARREWKQLMEEEGYHPNKEIAINSKEALKAYALLKSIFPDAKQVRVAMKISGGNISLYGWTESGHYQAIVHFDASNRGEVIRLITVEDK